MNSYTERLNETGKEILEILIQKEYIVDITEEQVLRILSLQRNASTKDGEIYMKNKKKRGGKIDLDKFSQKFSSKN